MPLQNLLVSEAHQRLMRSGQPDVVPMPAGQIVGRITEIRPVADVMADARSRRPDEALDRLRDGMRIAVIGRLLGGRAAARRGGPVRSRRALSGSTRSGRRKPTAATPGPRWPGGDRAPRGSSLGTAVSQLSARPPVTLAMTAMTMDHLTQGRVLLGIGTSNPQVVEGWYGQPYPRPLERTREYIDIVRQVIARREPVSYDGKHYQLPLPSRDRPGQAAALDPAPVPDRDPHLPRRGGTEERGPRGRDRRRLERHLLLARDERLLRHRPGRGLRPARRPAHPRDLRRGGRPARHHRR